MNEVVNIQRCFELFEDLFSPKIVAELNGQYVLAARCHGDKVPWHTHANEDEMFLVLEGRLELDVEGRDTVCLRRFERDTDTQEPDEAGAVPAA